MKRRFAANILSAIAIVGVLLAFWPVAQWAYASASQKQLKSQLAQAQTQAKTHKQNATRKTPTSSTRKQTKPSKPQPVAIRAWPLTRIVSPEIGLDAVVVQGLDEDSLRRGPGHEPRSALPGEAGNCVIAAHRNLYGSHFLRVDELLPGSIITLQTADASYRYSVIQTFVVADTETSIKKPPRDPNSPPLLTLFTCTIPRTATRVVVTAQLMSADAP